MYVYALLVVFFLLNFTKILYSVQRRISEKWHKQLEM